MKILLVTWDCGGNVPPFLGLSVELSRRGHGVHCVGTLSLRGRFDKIDVDFVAFSRGTSYAPSDRLTSSESQAAFAEMFFGQDIADDVRAVCERERPDILVIDFCLVSVMSLAELIGLPFLVLAHTLPGCILPIWETRKLLPSINQTRQHFNLAPLFSMKDLWSPSKGVLAATSRALDGPELTDHSVRLVYTGPIFEPTNQAVNATFPELPTDGRPEVLVSFSTTYMDQEETFANVIAALSSMHVHALVTTGPSIDPACLPAAENINIFQYLPHDALLTRVTAAILHGGHSSVAKALSYGVPILCIPHGRDQMYVSERVQSLGLGQIVPKEATPKVIALAMSELLYNSGFQHRCAKFAKEMKVEGPGAGNGADLIEAVVASQHV